jgi:hypothetical protein
MYRLWIQGSGHDNWLPKKSMIYNQLYKKECSIIKTRLTSFHILENANFLSALFTRWGASNLITWVTGLENWCWLMFFFLLIFFSDFVIWHWFFLNRIYSFFCFFFRLCYFHDLNHEFNKLSEMTQDFYNPAAVQVDISATAIWRVFYFFPTCKVVLELVYTLTDAKSYKSFLERS